MIGRAAPDGAPTGGTPSSTRRIPLALGIEAARAMLAAGGIVAFPTESSYGLGVDPRDERGVAAIYRVKHRERGRPLPVVIGQLDQLDLLRVDPADPLLALACRWPAPLSLVLATLGDVAAGAGTRTLAVRLPAHGQLRDLLREVGPLTATSANPSGEPPYLTADEVAQWLASTGEPALVLDGGRLAGGLPSTLVSLATGGRTQVLRQGAFPAAQVPDRISAASVENPVERTPRAAAGREADRNA